MVAQETIVKTNPSRFKKFLREVKAELKKVSWPSKQELISNTGVVFITVAVVSFLIWAIDAAFTQVLRFIIK
ncbi:preprotein translocase subunit SecE [Pelosinus sp. sgz500959]|uniref:preprotein translocase subunit SecE n=1 Tax=Pelosinus sp. sgz500959 TaxID=3242472 RepID=UPI00366BF088